MPSNYVQDATQRFTEFGGFTTLDPAGLPESVATWADGVLERVEQGLITLVALVTVCPEGALKSVRDDLTVMADRRSRQERADVQTVMLIISPEPLTRSQYERWQELKVNRGAVRLVPWIVDLTRNQVFGHQGPPFGIDPDIETLAVPEPAPEKPAAQQPARQGEPDEFPRPWVTLALLAVIIGVWIAMTIQGGSLQATESDNELLIAWGAAARPDLWLEGQFWRMLTAAFLHIGILHLAMNSYSLWLMGRAVEWLYGPVRMIYVYLAAAVAGSLTSAVLGPPYVLSAGASGAIFGLLGAIIWYRVSSPHRDRIKVRPLIMTLLLNAGLFVVGQNFLDNWAHAGGLVGGIVAAAAVGVPAVEGMKPPRFRLGRTGRIAAAVALAAVLVAFVTGALVPPGPGQDLARAKIALDKDRYEEAAGQLERVVRRSPNVPEYRSALIQSYLLVGKCTMANSHLIQLEKRNAEYEEIPDLKAWIAQKCGR